jgi:hypothetical protein
LTTVKICDIIYTQQNDLGETTMTNEQKILMLKQRRALLEARGIHNNRLVAKVDRQIRALEKKEN